MATQTEVVSGINELIGRAGVHRMRRASITTRFRALRSCTPIAMSSSSTSPREC